MSSNPKPEHYKNLSFYWHLDGKRRKYYTLVALIEKRHNSFIPTHIPEIPYFFPLKIFPKSKSPNLSPTIYYITIGCPLYCITVNTPLPQPIGKFFPFVSREIKIKKKSFQKIQGQRITILGDLVLKDKIFVYDLLNQRIGWTNYDCSMSVNVSTNINTGRTEFVNAGQMSNDGSSRDQIRGMLALLLPIIMLTGLLFL
ncbi:hypothetical protein E1A91_D05G410500v1 [Gossypium mustelinum]|uniref:Peptidase A1 domain-containing protein n=1 Tax=Gossypium mustelinum TaxID=34275 RepID=A0A5D2V6W5_GOSMU|nr:hypothetical protein E1A91_D05G410500v1 [Gossypium mustelinum]